MRPCCRRGRGDGQQPRAGPEGQAGVGVGLHTYQYGGGETRLRSACRGKGIAEGGQPPAIHQSTPPLAAGCTAAQMGGWPGQALQVNPPGACGACWHWGPWPGWPPSAPQCPAPVTGKMEFKGHWRDQLVRGGCKYGPALQCPSYGPNQLYMSWGSHHVLASSTIFFSSALQRPGSGPTNCTHVACLIHNLL